MTSCGPARRLRLTLPEDAARLFDEAEPELSFDLAAVVGGIGANRASPALLVREPRDGPERLEQARLHETPKLVIAGTVARPKLAPVRSARRACGRDPRGDERALWHREEGAPRRCSGVPRAVRPQHDLPAADEPVRAARQLRSRDVACDPGADQEDDRGRDEESSSGATARRRASSSMWATAPRVRAGGRALRRGGAGEPRCGTRDLDPRPRGADRGRDGYEGQWSGTRRCPAASRAGASTGAARASSSGSTLGRGFARGSSARSPGTGQSSPACAGRQAGTLADRAERQPLPAPGCRAQSSVTVVRRPSGQRLTSPNPAWPVGRTLLGRFVRLETVKQLSLWCP